MYKLKHLSNTLKHNYQIVNFGFKFYYIYNV